MEFLPLLQEKYTILENIAFLKDQIQEIHILLRDLNNMLTHKIRSIE